jgi:hypothetical protein
MADDNGAGEHRGPSRPRMTSCTAAFHTLDAASGAANYYEMATAEVELSLEESRQHMARTMCATAFIGSGASLAHRSRLLRQPPD